MEEVYCFIIIAILAYIIARILYWWGKRWKAKAQHAYMIIGQHGDSEEEREWGYRNALLAGEKKALMFYACAAMEKFTEDKPLTPVPFDDGLGNVIPFVYYDYYLPMRIRNYGTVDQQELSWLVNEFKEGRKDATSYFLDSYSPVRTEWQVDGLVYAVQQRAQLLCPFQSIGEAVGKIQGVGAGIVWHDLYCT